MGALLTYVCMQIGDLIGALIEYAISSQLHLNQQSGRRVNDTLISKYEAERRGIWNPEAKIRTALLPFI